MLLRFAREGSKRQRAHRSHISSPALRTAAVSSFCSIICMYVCVRATCSRRWICAHVAHMMRMWCVYVAVLPSLSEERDVLLRNLPHWGVRSIRKMTTCVLYTPRHEHDRAAREHRAPPLGSAEPRGKQEARAAAARSGATESRSRKPHNTTNSRECALADGDATTRDNMCTHTCHVHVHQTDHDVYLREYHSIYPRSARELRSAVEAKSRRRERPAAVGAGWRRRLLVAQGGLARAVR